MKAVIFLTIFLVLTAAVCAEQEKQGLHSLDIGKIVITPSKINQKYEELPQNVSVVGRGSISDLSI